MGPLDLSPIGLGDQGAVGPGPSASGPSGPGPVGLGTLSVQCLWVHLGPYRAISFWRCGVPVPPPPHPTPTAVGAAIWDVVCGGRAGRVQGRSEFQSFGPNEARSIGSGPVRPKPGGPRPIGIGPIGLA